MCSFSPYTLPLWISALYQTDPLGSIEDAPGLYKAPARCGIPSTTTGAPGVILVSESYTVDAYGILAFATASYASVYF